MSGVGAGAEAVGVGVVGTAAAGETFAVGFGDRVETESVAACVWGGAETESVAAGVWGGAETESIAAGAWVVSGAADAVSPGVSALGRIAED